MTVREASPDDYEAILALYGQWLRTERFRSRDSDSIMAVLRSARAYSAVADEDRILLGFVTASLRSVGRYPAPIAEIDELFVLPAHRRKGLARQLVTHVEDQMRACGCCRLYVATAYDQPDGPRLYSALGFADNGQHFRKALS
jgi:aminoglycoside 6'-N-acetyltransferase I